MVDRHLEAPLSAADLFGAQGDRAQVEHPSQHWAGPPFDAEQPSGSGGELKAGQLAGEVHRWQQGAGQARSIGGHQEEAEPGGGAGDDDENVGHVAVEHEGLVPDEDIAVARPGGQGGHSFVVPTPVVLGAGHRGRHPAGHD